VADLLAELITAVSSFTGTRVFAGTVPASPAVCTAVVPTGGFVRAGDPTRFPTFQVIHRNTNVQSGFSFVNSLHSRLANAWDVLPTITARVEAVTEPGGYAYVNDKLVMFSLNYRLTSLRL
jgi:hypothetical protein